MSERLGLPVHFLRPLLLGIVLVLVALGNAQAQDEEVIIIGHAEITEAYDPAHAFNPTSGMVNQVTYDTLVQLPRSHPPLWHAEAEPKHLLYAAR